MGTRHLIAVVKDGEFKLSQYGQWDGYFSCKGIDFTKWVRENLQGKNKRQYEYRIENFSQKIDMCGQVSSEFLEQFTENLKQYSSHTGENNGKFALPYQILVPVFHRDTSVKILDIIMEIRPYEYEEGQKFPVFIDTDTSMVEYAYVIDLDKERVYYLTSHDFNKDMIVNTPMPKVVQEKFVDTGLDCFYSSSIQGLPSVSNLSKYMKEIGLMGD